MYVHVLHMYEVFMQHQILDFSLPRWKAITHKRAQVSTLVHTKVILWMSELLLVSNVNDTDMERIVTFLKNQIFGDLLLQHTY